MMMTSKQIETRASWNLATQAHNAHKGDQAAFLKEGGDTLFPEELSLLGELTGKSVLHLQCNSGQDSLCLARRGAHVVGVDFSNEAICFAKQLSVDSGIAAAFEEAEIGSWLKTTPDRFDIAFASYGVLGWNEDLDSWFQGIYRVLNPGGRLVIVEFHPILFSIDSDFCLSKDDYFDIGPFTEAVGDYVGDSDLGLLHGANKQEVARPSFVNPYHAYSYQHTMGHIVTSAIESGLCLEKLLEWPHSNGWRANASLVADGRRWVFPRGTPRIPLMFGLVAKKNGISLKGDLRYDKSNF